MTYKHVPPPKNQIVWANVKDWVELELKQKWDENNKWIILSKYYETFYHITQNSFKSVFVEVKPKKPIRYLNRI